MPKLTVGVLVNRGPAGLLKSKPKQGTKPGDKTGEEPGGVVAEESKHLEGPGPGITPALRDKAVPVANLIPDPNNAREHNERNINAIRDSLVLYGQVKPIVVQKKTRVVIAGNGTLEAAKLLGWEKIAAVYVEMDAVAAAGYGLADNRTAELATWDWKVVKQLEKLISEADIPVVGWTTEEIEAMRKVEWVEPDVEGGEGQGGGIGGEGNGEETATLNLSDRFIVPPFSTLDARAGYWQNRKRAWLALGIQSEIGRGEKLAYRIEKDGTWVKLGEEGGEVRGPKANATTTGRKFPAAKQPKDGKGVVRGDSTGKPTADD